MAHHRARPITVEDLSFDGRLPPAYEHTPGSEPTPRSEAEPVLPVYQMQEPVQLDWVFQDFAGAVRNLSRFNISFSGNSIVLLGNAAREAHPHRDVYSVLNKVLVRVFHAVVALLDVEWRAAHIEPYTQHIIHFEPNSRFPTAHPPALWVQHFDVIVQATSIQRLNRVTGREAAHVAASTGVNNLGRRTALPAFPLFERRHTNVPSSSGIQADTAIDDELQTADLAHMGYRPVHPVWVDRFTKSESAHLASPGHHLVWWQWTGTGMAVLRGGSTYAAEFDKQHDVNSMCFPTSRTPPAILLVFKGPAQLQPQLRRSSGAGSSAPNVLRR
ncbi:hypothetical protein JCM11251_001416 [Rhodosporidiobolus azoricus]